MIDIKSIGIKIIVLFIFSLFVENYPNMKKYSNETKFNMYRSLLCLYFTLYAFDNLINNFGNISDPFTNNNNIYSDISEWFNAYLLLDIIKMIMIKNTRLDLYIHHAIAIIIININLYYNKIGFLGNMLLINEIISIVSGIDSIYIEENKLDESRKCKIFRKNIIKYIRIPIWIIGILIIIYNKNNFSSLLLLFYLLFTFIFILLDNYWLYKCDKVINKKL